MISESQFQISMIGGSTMGNPQKSLIQLRGGESKLEIISAASIAFLNISGFLDSPNGVPESMLVDLDSYYCSFNLQSIGGVIISRPGNQLDYKTYHSSDTFNMEWVYPS